MLCRALLTALAFSYLICVLILSGVQKDELDVNTLRKLQRHNVNIDDMNNETLHKECLSNFGEDKITTQINIKENDNQDKYITTVDPPTATNGSDIEANNLERTIKKTELEMIMKYYINQQSTQYSFTTKPTIQQSQQNVNIHKKYNHDRLLSEPKKNAEVSVEAEHSKNDQTRNLETILKFWQRFKQDKTVSTDNRNSESSAPKNNSNNSKDYDQKSKRQSVQRNIKSDLSTNKAIQNDRVQNDQRKEINKMIEEYFSNQRTNNVNTTILSDVKLNVDLNNRQINAPQEIENGNQYHFGGVDDYSNWSNIRNNVNVYKNNVGPKPIDFTDNEKPQSDNKLKSEHDKEYNQIQRNNDAILRLTEQFSDQSKILPRYNQRGPNTNQFDENNYPKSYSMEKQNIITENKALGNNNYYNINTAQVTKMPVNVLKEIAESVKAIVLKDLRNEMATVSPSISTTVKTHGFTENKYKKPEANQSQVIQKLMELIEQMKASNKSQTGTMEKKQQLSHNQAIIKEYPVNINFPAIPYDNPYAFRRPEQFPVISNNPYTNFKFRTQNYNLNKKIHNKNNGKLNVSHKAAIIQTNSNEIAPLAIPLSKPSILINQNIMITTVKPIRNTKSNYNLMSNRYNLKFLGERKKQKIRFNEPKTNRIQHAGDFDSPTRYDLKDTINKYRDAELRIRSRDEVNNSYDRMPRKDDYHQRTHTRNDFQGFHERLERVDDGSRYSSWENKRYNERDRDRCGVKVASRQQLPLNTIKQRSSYDDTHFRNFLKTQQKVNAMLERVLATKAISDIPHDGIRSVELP